MKFGTDGASTCSKKNAQKIQTYFIKNRNFKETSQIQQNLNPNLKKIGKRNMES
jgi:hypothetical protein